MSEFAERLGVLLPRIELGASIAEPGHAEPGVVRFRDPAPAPEVVAEEVVHLAQFGLGRGSGAVSEPEDGAEHEARELARQLVAGGAVGAPRVPATAARMRATDAEVEVMQRRIQAHATSAASALDDALDSSWGDAFLNMANGGRIRQMLSTYFGRVRTVISNAGAHFEWLLDQSREILQAKYHDLCNRSLSTDLGRTLEGAQLADCQRWITVQGIARPPSAGRGAATTAAPAEAAAPAPPVTASEDSVALETTLRARTVAAVAALRRELEATFYTDDSVVVQHLRDFREQVTSTLAAHQVTDRRALPHWLTELRQEYSRATTRSLEGDLRCHVSDSVLGNHLSESLRLIGASAGGPAIRRAAPAEAATGGDLATTVTAIQGQTGSLHLIIERMIGTQRPPASPAGARTRRALVPELDQAHDALVAEARRRQLGPADARRAVEQAYRAETGHDLLTQLRVAVAGDATVSADVAARLGYPQLADAGEASGGDASPAGQDAVVRNLFGRLAREMYGYVTALRSAELMDFLQVDRIDRAMDRVDTQGAAHGLSERSARLDLFEEIYRTQHGVPFRAHLLQACEHSASTLAELERRLGIEIGEISEAGGQRTETAHGAEGAQLAVALQELHDIFEETMVDDDQVLRGVQAARRAGQAEQLSAADVRTRYEDRFRVGLAAQIRARISGLETRRRALQAIGVIEDRSEELVSEGATGAERRALRVVVEAAERAAAAILAARAVAATVNEQVRTYVEAARPHEAALGEDPAARRRAILERQYAAVGGDLLADLQALGEPGRPAVRALGYRDLAGQLAARGAADAAPSSDDSPAGRFRAEAGLRLPAFFGTLERDVQIDRSLAGQASAGRWVDEIDRAWDALLAWDGAPSTGERRRIVYEAFAQTYGLTLPHYLGARLARYGEVRSQVSRRLGIEIERSAAAIERATQTDEQVDLTGIAVEDASVLRDQAGHAFDLEQAREAAQQLQRALGARDLHRLTQVMQGEGRGRRDEERRIIREVYDRLYPESPLELTLRRAFGAQPQRLRQARSLCGLTGQLGIRDRILVAAGDRDYRGVRELMLGLDDSERDAMRDDGEVMAALRGGFGPDQFSALREVLRGDEGLDEVAAARGGDADEILADLRSSARVQYRRERQALLGEDPTLGQSDRRAELQRRIRVRMMAWSAERQADPSATSALLDALDAEQIEEATLTMQSDGSLGAFEEVRRNPGRASLLGDLRALSEEERAALRADSEFMSRLRSQVGDAERRAEALAILDGDALAQAELAGQRGSLRGIYAHAADMDASEMAAFAQDSGSAREHLDGYQRAGSGPDGPSDRTRFDDMVGEMRALSSITDENERERARLIFHHKYRILGASGHGAILQRALDAHNEEDARFDQHARRRCAQDVRVGLLAMLHATTGGNEIMVLASDLIERAPGAVDRMQRWSVRLVDDTPTLEYTLEHAPETHVAREWSNALKPGAHGETFAPVVRTWVDSLRPRTGPEWLAFRQFRLDVSADLRTVLADEHDLGGASDADMVRWVNTVRGRIQAIRPEALYEVLRPEVPGLADTDIELLNDRTRQAATQHLADADDVALDLDGGRFARGLTQADEAETNAAADLAQMFNAAMEDDVVDAGEDEALGEQRALLQARRADYQRARDEIAEVAQTVGGIVVAIVGTALAGPAGGGIGVAMLTAAGEGLLNAAIQEAVHGRNYEFVRTGLPQMVRNTVQAGIFHGCGQWVSRAAGEIGLVGDAAQRMARWQEALRQRAPTAWMLETAALDAAQGVVTNAAQEVVESVVVGVYQHGTTQGILQAREDWDRIWDRTFSMQNFLVELATNLATGMVGGAAHAPREDDAPPDAPPPEHVPAATPEEVGAFIRDAQHGATGLVETHGAAHPADRDGAGGDGDGGGGGEGRGGGSSPDDSVRVLPPPIPVGEHEDAAHARRQRDRFEEAHGAGTSGTPAAQAEVAAGEAPPLADDARHYDHLDGEGRVVRPEAAGSTTTRGAGGDITHVAMGDRVVRVLRPGEDATLWSTRFEHCGATVIRGRRDGDVVILMGHVLAADTQGHWARLVQDVQWMREQGVTGLEVVAVLNPEVRSGRPIDAADQMSPAYQSFPDDRRARDQLQLAAGGELRDLQVRQPARDETHTELDVVATREGTSVFEHHRDEPGPARGEAVPQGDASTPEGRRRLAEHERVVRETRAIEHDVNAQLAIERTGDGAAPRYRLTPDLDRTELSVDPETHEVLVPGRREVTASEIVAAINLAERSHRVRAAEALRSSEDAHHVGALARSMSEVWVERYVADSEHYPEPREDLVFVPDRSIDRPVAEPDGTVRVPPHVAFSLEDVLEARRHAGLDGQPPTTESATALPATTLAAAPDVVDAPILAPTTGGGHTPVAGHAPSLDSVPSVRNGEFSRWFDSLTPDQLDTVWQNRTLRDAVEARLRHPGGLHEWHLVSRAPTFKRWGLTAAQIHEMRTAIEHVHFTNPPGRHGGRGSTRAHNEILEIIDTSLDYGTFVRRLQNWAHYRLVGGVDGLPPGLRG